MKTKTYGFLFTISTESLGPSPSRIVIETPNSCFDCGCSLAGRRLHDVLVRESGIEPRREAVCEDCVATTPGSAEYERQTRAALEEMT